LNSLFFFALVAFLVKARPDWGAPDFNHGGRRERALINCAHYHLRPCSPLRGTAFSRVSRDAFNRLAEQKRGPDPGESDPETNFRMQ